MSGCHTANTEAEPARSFSQSVSVRSLPNFLNAPGAPPSVEVEYLIALSLIPLPQLRCAGASVATFAFPLGSESF